MIRRTIATYLFAIPILFFPFQNLTAQEYSEPAPRVSPHSISQDFDVAADLTNVAWSQASPVYIKHQVQPNDNAPALVQTGVKVLYSEENLYISFQCEDPRPSEIRASIADRDQSFRDDFVGIFLDPFNNNQHAYEFFANPLGIQMDGMRTRGNEDMNYDLLWHSEGKITDSGYNVVMKIPFKSLNFPDRKVQDWSIQFIRNYPRNSRYQFTWSKVDLNNSCLMCQNGTINGMQGVESSNTIEILPYGMSYQSSAIDNPSDPSSGLDHEPVDARFGGSISYSPTSTASLNAVFNPDFSQVETDAAQIGVNETFALFYPEKRPFFMKGSDLFSTPLNLFYSRTINRPLAAGKLTKQADKYTFAFLTAYDRNTPFIIPGLYGSSQVRSEVNTYNNVLRGKYNFGDESYVGGLITTRNQTQGSNYVGSIDWRLLLSNHYYFSGQLAYSDTKELDDTNLFNDTRTFGETGYDAALNGQHFGGTLVGTQFSREAKYYSFTFEYSSFSPTFQSQSGFINRTDRRQFESSQNISFYPNTSWWTNGSFNVNANWRYDFGGQFLERFIYTGLFNRLIGQTNLSVGFLPVNDERFRGSLFKNMNRIMLNLNTNPMDLFSIGGHVDFGKYIYRTNNPTMGRGYNANIFASIKPTSRLKISFNYRYSTLSSLDDLQNYYSGDIYRMTGRYNFTKKLFARLIGQYNSFSEQIQVYPLVYYKLNPFSKFYIGMTDYMNHFDQQGPNGFTGYKQTDRQFFVKFQYLIRS